MIEEHCHFINCKVWVHDFVTADKFGKMVGLFKPLLLKFVSSGLDMAPWQNVGLATLIGVVESRLRTRAAVQPSWE